MRCNFYRFFTGLVVAIALAPLLTSAQTPQAPCPVCTTDSPGFDKDSGFCLPSTVTGLTVVPSSAENLALDKADGVTSLSFIDKRQMFAVTAQLQNRPKPTKVADLAVVRSIEKYTLAAHPGAKMPLNEIGIFELGQREYPAYGKVFTWPVSGGTLSSIVWIVPHKKRYLILRTEFVDTKNILEKTFEAIEKAAEVQTSVASQICEVR
jgi:hypothetical protein